MAENTRIEWTDATFNPWIGCTKVSPGCDNCYAEALMDVRHGRAKWGAGNPRSRTAPSTWAQPLKWNRAAEKAGKRASVFCASLADVFDNEVDDSWRVDLAALILATPMLDWLLLTKRIGNASAMLARMFSIPGEPPRNVFVGATMVNQPEVDRDWNKLMEAKHLYGVKVFGSLEPLLGPIELPPFGSPYIDGVIVGGESGHQCRIMHPDWVRDLRDQCADYGVDFHFKQWGEIGPYDSREPHHHVFWVGLDGHVYGTPPADAVPMVRWGKKRAGRLLDGVAHDALPWRKAIV
ncbi:phage Gp37/Gp68 family protein [Sphingopyxis sp. NJF-3]